MKKEKPQISHPFKEKPEFFRGSNFFKIAKEQKDPRFIILESQEALKGKEIKNIQKFISIFQDPKYGLLDFLAENQAVIGETENAFMGFSGEEERSFYLIRERIEGKKLEDLKDISDNIAEQIDEFLFRNAGVFIDTFKRDGRKYYRSSNGLSLDIFTTPGGSGIRGNAFVGKNLMRSDKEDKFYFFDLYPVLGWDKETFTRLSLNLINDLKLKPGFQNKDFDFPQFRKALKEM